MARKTYSFSLEEDIRRDFKTKCSEDNVNMNDLLELLMDKYLQGDIVVKKEIRLEVRND